MTAPLHASAPAMQHRPVGLYFQVEVPPYAGHLVLLFREGMRRPWRSLPAATEFSLAAA